MKCLPNLNRFDYAMKCYGKLESIQDGWLLSSRDMDDVCKQFVAMVNIGCYAILSTENMRMRAFIEAVCGRDHPRACAYFPCGGR